MSVQRLIQTARTLAELSESEWLRLACEGTGQAVFDWTLGDDRIQWSDNALDVLPVRTRAAVETGQGLLALLDEAGHSQLSACTRPDVADGDSFDIECRIQVADRTFAWIEIGGVCLNAGGRLERVVGTVRLVTQRKAEEIRLRHLATYDDLTGQINRTTLRETLGQHLARAKAGEVPCTFLVAAIDGLAVLNEAYGFETADEVILAASRRLASVLGGQDVIGRISGNKFGLVLPGCDRIRVEAICERLRAAVGSTVIATSAGAVSATVSIGAVLLPDGAETSQEAMLRAEEALDRAKSRGRDSFFLYQASPEKAHLRKRNIALGDQVLTALTEKRLKLAYQPIVDARDGRPVQYECLLRMMRPDGSIMPAGEFIPVAEQLGLVRLIDRRVLELAAEVLLGAPRLRLSVNVSGISVGDPQWMALFTDIADIAPDVARRLTIELTETAALGDIADSARFVSMVRAKGAKLAIDDFGAGYTSFRNLQILEVDSVKIDGSFIKGLSENRDNQVFVRTLIGLAKHFAIATTAEWVSNAEDAALLRDMGVDYFQGFLYGAPSLEAPQA